MNDYQEHFNIDVIRKEITSKRYRRFAIVRNRHCWYIAPIQRRNGVTYRCGCVYDNCDVHGKEVMSKDELCMRFLMIFGYSVKYRWNDEDCTYSNL